MVLWLVSEQDTNTVLVEPEGRRMTTMPTNEQALGIEVALPPQQVKRRKEGAVTFGWGLVSRYALLLVALVIFQRRDV